MDHSEQRSSSRELMEKALRELRELRLKLKRAPQNSQAIAVVGMGCRFPAGASSPEAFWQLLCSGRDAIAEIPASRWDIDRYYDPNLFSEQAMSTRWGGFIDGVERFDPSFFGVSKGEACGMDPQQRILLETVQQAFEHAGIDPHKLAGSQTGVFVGACLWDYLTMLRGAPQRGGTGVASSIIANRVSYTWDLRGPSMVIDTACSSSLVAVDAACRSLRTGASDLALATGVHLVLAPTWTVAVSQAGMMAADGRCKTFDARADGYVRGEGCGVVILKRLDEALASGDQVLAVIRGTASNHDGRSNGLTAPNGNAQKSVVRAAQRDAGIGPDEIGYVEAHGTGTALGDAVEVGALSEVFADRGADRGRCLLGSVKSNIGHLEAAAGIAGLIKVVLSLQHEALPPNLHFQQPNPELDLARSPFRVVDSVTPWPRSGSKRAAGISAFGFGGTNAHVIVEEAPVRPAPSARSERSCCLLPISARTPAALRALAEQYRRQLQQLESPIGDLCHTAGAGRSHYSCRLAVVGDSSEALQSELARWLERDQEPRPIGRAPRIGFVFTGQGSQFPQMGRALFESQPVFREVLERADRALATVLTPSLLEAIYPDPDDTRALIDQTRYTQPALFAFEYALAEMLRSFGVVPSAVIGHSIGEYVAACVAGMISFEDALRLVARRAELMDAAPGHGTMALIKGELAEVEQVLRSSGQCVDIAAINGPTDIVVSGPAEAVERVLDACEEVFLTGKRLRVSHAFHSRCMEPVLDAFELAASAIRYMPAQVDLISNLTGQRMRTLDARHWRDHMRSGVLFHAGMETMLDTGVTAVIEVGPSGALIKTARMAYPERELSWLSLLARREGDWTHVLGALGQLYAAGASLDFAALDAPHGFGIVRAPHYPFERATCWLRDDEIRPELMPALASATAA